MPDSSARTGSAASPTSTSSRRSPSPSVGRPRTASSASAARSSWAGHPPLGRHVRRRDRGRGHQPRRRRPPGRRRADAGARLPRADRDRSRPGSWSRRRTTRPTTTASRCSTATGSSSTTRSRTSSSRSSGGRTSSAAVGERVLGPVGRRPRPASSATRAPPGGLAHASGGRTCTSSSTARNGSGRAGAGDPRRDRRTRARSIHAEPDGIEHQRRLRRHRSGLARGGRRARAAPTSGSRSTATPTGCVAVDSPGGSWTATSSSASSRSTGWRAARCRAAPSWCRVLSQRRASSARWRRPAGRSSGRPSATSTSSRGCSVSARGSAARRAATSSSSSTRTSGDGIVTALEVLRVMCGRGRCRSRTSRRRIPLLPQQQRAVTARHKDQWEGDPGSSGRPSRRRRQRLGADAAGSSSGPPARSPRCG